jgi:hypothetical protein
MISKIIFGIAICFGLVCSMEQNCLSQGKTKEKTKTKSEATKAAKVDPKLKAELLVFAAEWKSIEAAKRVEKINGFSAPDDSGIASVDELAKNSTKMLTSTKEFNVLVPEMYKRTIGETIDGVTDITTKPPSNEELLQLAKNIATQIKAVSDASVAVSNASSDISKASFMQAPKGTKSLNYSKDILSCLAPQLQLSLNVVNNLIATLKSSGNY